LNSGENQAKTSLYIVLNPVAGNARAEDIRSLVEEHFPEQEYSWEIYETTGKEDVARLTRQACEQGASRVFAAGGDGTVAGVVNGLVGTGIPLGIIPVGTGNGLARALRLPLDTGEAVQLLAGEHELLPLDLMQVEDQYYTLNVSAGISGQAMRATPAKVKRRFGMFAYVWTIIKKVLGINPMRYRLTIDGVPFQVRATEVLVSNGTLMEKPLEALGPPLEFKDGKFDVYIVSARSVLDHLRMVWELIFKPPRKTRNLHHWKASKQILIDALGSQQPTQGDGEPLGNTPLEVTVVSEALQVIVPKGTQHSSNGGKK
jgi:diacylglycerol kinase (ATP)